MNVMRPHPTNNRGKRRTIRNANKDLNIFQTVRAGTRNLQRAVCSTTSSSSRAIGSSTLSRLQWSNQRSENASSSEAPSVARILSEGEGSLRTNALESAVKSSTVQTVQTFDEPRSYCPPSNETPFPQETDIPDEPPSEFFCDILDAAAWTGGVSPHDREAGVGEHRVFTPDGQAHVEREEGNFFSLEHLLHNTETSNKPISANANSGSSLTPHQPAANVDEYGGFFKTPLPLSKGNSRGLPDDDYESIFNTPGVRELPRLSTPLYSAKLGSCENSTCYSKTTPSANRTKTTKSVTDPVSSVESAVIVALTEGRGYAVGEVGLAFINLNRPVLTLSQISDCQTYAKTLAKINLFNPVELIVPDTFVSERNTSDLFKRVTEYFLSIKVVSLKRIYFNGEQGLEIVRSLCLPEYSPIDVVTLKKYYALAAAAALLKYIEHEHSTVFAKESIQVAYEAAKGVVSLDVASSRRLELVRTHGNMINPEKYSLLGIMDSTITLGGKRRLRTEILQPPAIRETIEERQEVVSFLVQDSSLLASLQGSLAKFSTAEKLMWLCRKTPDFKQEKKTNEIMTNYVLLLKSSLENIPPLRELLSESENDFLINVRDALSDRRFQDMEELISQKIQPDAKPIKGSFQNSEISRCFSIKDEVNGLLDVARSTYSRLVQEIQDLITKLADEHELPLKMGQSAELGFHGQYTLPKNSDIRGNEIPPIFTDVKIKGNVCHVSTDEMLSLNVRVRRAVQEIQLISNVVLFELIKALRPSVGCLYNLCENVAVLDLICSLAKYSMTPNFVRPTFGDNLDVQGGRHPVLDHIDPIKPTPNDIFSSKNKNFNIVTGPNMSGKTVYLLQVALLQIMAQMGSYVPADRAEFRITDHIYVRKDGSESVENKASSFVVEVKEIMYCLNTMTDLSVIILDELCTGTNNEGGTAVAWAISEELLCRRAFTFVASHLHFLTNLEKIFVNVSNYHMEAIEGSQPGIKYGPLTYTHRLLQGVTLISHYGLRLMMTTSLPEKMKNEATNVVEALSAKRANCLELAKTIPLDVRQVMDRVDKLENFMEDLYSLSKSDGYSLESVQKLQRLAVDDIIIEEMRSRVLNDPGTPPSQVLRHANRSCDSPGESNRVGSAGVDLDCVSGRAETPLGHCRVSIRNNSGNRERSDEQGKTSNSETSEPNENRFRLNSSQNSPSSLRESNHPGSRLRSPFGNRFWLDFPQNSQSTLDSDDYSDAHVENDENIPLEVASKRVRCSPSSDTPRTRQGTSTSPQYTKSSNVQSLSGSSGFGFESN